MAHGPIPEQAGAMNALQVIGIAFEALAVLAVALTMPCSVQVNRGFNRTDWLEEVSFWHLLRLWLTVGAGCLAIVGIGFLKAATQ